MKFLVIAHVIHKRKPDDHILGYGPYVREMNLWFRHVKQVRVIAPMSSHAHDDIDLAYKHNNLEFIQVPGINFQTIGNTVRSLILLPLILWKIFLGMCWANHIHLRCPGNIGFLGCITQILFPWKAKTETIADVEKAITHLSVNRFDKNHRMRINTFICYPYVGLEHFTSVLPVGSYW